MSKKVAVIGAGIAGITTAYYLAKAGHDVTVYEQERYPAMRTSFANGGQVSVSNSEVWTTINNVKKGVRWMFTKDAPLLIRPSFEWSKISWLVKFLFYTLRGDYKKNTQKTIEMGLASRKLYENIIKEEQLQFDQSNCGILHFYKNDTYFDQAKVARHIYEEAGCEFKILTPSEVVKHEPTLKRIETVGGAWTGDDWTGDIHKFCYELAEVLKKRYHVEFIYEEKVFLKEILEDYDNIIVCAGVGSVSLAKEIGESLPIYPVKGYSITINNVERYLLPKTSLLDDEAKIVTSTLGNKLRVAGTAELCGENYDIRQDRIKPLLRWVHTNFPNINTHDYSSWACLRPMTPNMMPITKNSDTHHKVIYNTGHGHLGWTLAPYTAKLVTQLI